MESVNFGLHVSRDTEPAWLIRMLKVIGKGTKPYQGFIGRIWGRSDAPWGSSDTEFYRTLGTENTFYIGSNVLKWYFGYFYQLIS